MTAIDQIAAIELELATVLGAMVSLPVINERNPGAQYPASFMSFRITDMEGSQFPLAEYATTTTASVETYSETIGDNCYFTCLIRCVGANAFAKLASVRAQLRSAARWGDLFTLIGYGGVDDVQNVSDVINGRIREMAILHLEFYGIISETTTSDYISSTEIIVTEPTLPFEETITIEQGD